MKLKTLQPRLGTLPNRLAPLSQATRLRGRAAVNRRARWLYQHPLCVMCEAEGKVTAAEEVDHVVALVNGGADSEDNFQSLCTAHHKEKTAKDLGHAHRPRRAIGPDGWPV